MSTTKKELSKKMLCFPGHFNFNARFANGCELISCSFVATLFLPNSYVVVKLGEKKHVKANSRQNSAAKVPLTNATIIFATCSLHLHSSPSAFCCTKGLIASLGGAPMKAWVVVHIFPRLKLRSLVVE